MARANIKIPDELIQRLDEYAHENYISRSAVMCQACDDYLSRKEMQKLFGRMVDTFERLEQAKDVDEETKKQLDEFARLSKMLSGSL